MMEVRQRASPPQATPRVWALSFFLPAILVCAFAGRGPVSPYYNELRIRETAYVSGIGALANSRLQIKADRQFKRFAAQVGLDNSSLERSTKVRFEVYGDGRLLSRSPELGFADAAFALAAEVSGVGTIELVAREMALGRTPTVVTWAAAALYR